MLLSAIIVYYTDLLKMLRWWKIAIFLLLTFFLVVLKLNPNEFNLIEFYVPYWGGFLIKRKVSKINYLLPGDSDSRSKYLLSSSIGLIILFLIWYMVVHIINILFGNYDGLQALQMLIGKDILAILICLIATIGTGYNSEFLYKSIGKLKVAIMVILVLYPVLHIALLNQILSGYWLMISIVISYLCTFPFCYYSFSELKLLDTSYEKLRKPVKFI